MNTQYWLGGAVAAMFIALALSAPALAADASDKKLNTPRLQVDPAATRQLEGAKVQADEDEGEDDADKPSGKAKPSIRKDVAPQRKENLPAVQKKAPGQRKHLKADGAGGGPHIDRVTPTSGEPGTTVTLHGRHFGPDADGRWIALGHEGHGGVTGTDLLSWSDNRIRIRLRDNTRAGPAHLFIHLAPGDEGFTNQSNSVDFEVAGLQQLRPEVAEQVRNPGGGLSRGPTPELAEGVGGCPDPEISLSVRSVTDLEGSDAYHIYFLADIENVGDATFRSDVNQLSVHFSEGPSRFASKDWESRGRPEIELEPGGGSYAQARLLHWNPSSEFLDDVHAELVYDPDIRSDGNPANDDCDMSNNRDTLTVDELRSAVDRMAR